MTPRRFWLAWVVVAILLAPVTRAEPTPTPGPTPDGDTPSTAEQAAPAEPPPADATTLSMADMGWPEPTSFLFSRNVSSTTLRIPVPPGLTPSTYTARVELPIPLRAGSLTITQNSRVIGRAAPLPPDGSVVTIPIASAQVSGNWMTLTVTITALPPEGFCWDFRVPIRLSDGAVTFTGRPAAPTNVGNFLPPMLRRVTIALPPKPSRAESAAAVELAAILQRRYGGQLDVVVVPVVDGAAPQPGPVLMDRRILIKEGADNALVLVPGDGVPTLRIAGSGDNLIGQARLLRDESLPTAISTRAVIGPLVYESVFAGDAVRLQDLARQSELSNDGVWPAVTIPLDQTLFGHSIHGLRLNLVGSHTPIPESFGGEATIAVDGEVIDRWPVDSGGVIDRAVAIPDRLLDRVTNVVVAIRINGDMGNCGDYPAMSLRIDGTTVIESSPADPPIPAGFRSLPQTLLPRIRIGIGEDTFGDTARAVQIVLGLQRVSGVLLSTELTSLEEAIGSDEPAILIASKGWNDVSIALPVNVKPGTITLPVKNPAGEETALNLDSDAPVGSLQTVLDGQRTLLVATSNGAPQQLDALLGWLAGERGRWGALDGRAIISVPGQEPVTVANPDIGSTSRQSKYKSWSQWWGWGVGALVTLAALGALAIMARAAVLRGRRRSPVSTDVYGSDDPSVE